MRVLNLQPPPPPPPPPPPQSPPSTPNRVVAFTTPQNYADRLSNLIHQKKWSPLWCPTLTVGSTPQTISSVQSHFLSLDRFSAVAFTSRTGIAAFSQAMSDLTRPLLPPHGEIFTISALGKDAELLNRSFTEKLCENRGRIRVLVPPVATPGGLVEALGLGKGKLILCPVPIVVGLEEPPVVPEFLAGLGRRGWVPVRVNAYETRWRSGGVEELVGFMEEEGCGVDAIVFTSTGEVEGLLKGLGEMGLDWSMLRRMCPRMVVAAHGPVTAAGAERLGVGIDVVSSRFDSFDGVVDALQYRWMDEF